MRAGEEYVRPQPAQGWAPYRQRAVEVIMSQTITAVYENGVLRPLTPLALPDHARVELDVRPIAEPVDAAAQREQVRQALVTAGVLAHTDVPANAPEPLSSHERMTLAQTLAEAGVSPLSRSIIEEREGR